MKLAAVLSSLLLCQLPSALGHARWKVRHLPHDRIHPSPCMPYLSALLEWYEAHPSLSDPCPRRTALPVVHPTP